MLLLLMLLLRVEEKRRYPWRCELPSGKCCSAFPVVLRGNLVSLLGWSFRFAEEMPTHDAYRPPYSMPHPHQRLLRRSFGWCCFFPYQ